MAPQTSQIFILLLITLMGHSAMARSVYVPLISRQELPYLLGEVDNSDELYQDTKKVSDGEIDAQARWLWLKDLLLSDYDENSRRNSIFGSETKPTIPPLPQGGMARRNGSSGHKQKKSNSAWGEYMTPCHFKICNFGRKRNVFNL
ncbi:uncharacterized protein LOC119650182 isoform X1 [Hermetia illucens]|nr:uncharacterized protein LOC119650182 isoform X1 [Hermetia illucens]